MTRFDHLPTVFHLTHPKAGSQWIYQILAAVAPERIVIPHDDAQQFIQFSILPGMIYPTLYFSSTEFTTVKTPQPQLKIVVIRDLRDTLISLYFSAKYSHPSLYVFRQEQRRNFLNKESLDDGLRRLMCRDLSRIARLQTSWVNSGEPLFKYESLLEDEVGQMARLLEACQLQVDPEQLRNIVKFYSFKQRSGRERGVEDVHSHYRKGVSGDWRNYLTGSLLAEFKEYYDHTLIATGYETDRDWGLDALPKGYSISFDQQSEALDNRNLTHCWCAANRLVPFSTYYLKCLQCGTLVYKQQHTANDSDIQALLQHQFRRALPLIERGPNERHTNDDPTLNLLQTILRYQQPGAKVLDLGCGNRQLVNLLRLAGFEVTCQALEKENDEGFDQKSTPQLPYRSLEQLFTPNAFKLILVMNTLQNMHNPLETLRQCLKLLDEAGAILTFCFLFDDPDPYEELCRSGSPLLEFLLVPQYRYLFSRRALKYLFEEAGYQWLNFGEHYQLMAGKQPLQPHSDATLAQNLSGSVEGSVIAYLQEKNHQLQTLAQYQTTVGQRLFAQFKQMLNPPASVALHYDLIVQGLGWHQLEQFQGDTFCWASNMAELIVLRPTGQFRDLCMEVEPGPGLNGQPLQIQFLDETGRAVAASGQIVGRQWLEVTLPVVAGERLIFRLKVEGGGYPTPNDPRILNFRVFQFGWTNKRENDAKLSG